MNLDYQKYKKKLPHECGSPILYNEMYDSIYCPECNIWLEKACTDPECYYCFNRPEKPCVIYEKTKSCIHRDSIEINFDDTKWICPICEC